MPSAVNIRFAQKGDIEAIHHILTRPEVIWGTLQFPSRRVQSLNRTADVSEDSFSLVAEVAEGPDRGRVVGNIGMQRGTGRKRHVAGLGITVDPAYHGRGVGTALMEACLETALRWWSPLRIELEVYPDNERALALYRKFGFEVEGSKTGVAIRQGKYVDTLVMSRVEPEAAIESRDRIGEGPSGDLRPEEGPAAKRDLTGVADQPGGEVRPPVAGDAPGIRKLYENPSVLRHSSFLPWTIPAVEKIVEDLEKAADRHMLVWVREGFVYGEITMAPGRFRMSRTATISLHCVPPETASGAPAVARDLLQAIVDLSENWLGLHRLEMETYPDESWLFPVLEQMGFRREARLRKASLRDGVFEDRLVWGRVSETW